MVKCNGERHTGWDGDNGMGDFVSKVSLSGFLHLGQNHGADFFRGLKWSFEKKRVEEQDKILDSRNHDPLPCV